MTRERIIEIFSEQMEALDMRSPEFSLDDVVRDQKSQDWWIEIQDRRQPAGSQSKRLTLRDVPHTDESVSESLAAQLATLKSSS